MNKSTQTSITPARLRAAGLAVHNAISRQMALGGRQLVAGCTVEGWRDRLEASYRKVAEKRGVELEFTDDAVWLVEAR